MQGSEAQLDGVLGSALLSFRGACRALQERWMGGTPEWAPGAGEVLARGGSDCRTPEPVAEGRSGSAGVSSCGRVDPSWLIPGPLRLPWVLAGRRPCFPPARWLSAHLSPRGLLSWFVFSSVLSLETRHCAHQLGSTMLRAQGPQATPRPGCRTTRTLP